MSPPRVGFLPAWLPLLDGGAGLAMVEACVSTGPLPALGCGLLLEEADMQGMPIPQWALLRPRIAVGLAGEDPPNGRPATMGVS